MMSGTQFAELIASVAVADEASFAEAAMLFGHGRANGPGGSALRIYYALTSDAHTIKSKLCSINRSVR
jgi:hypothetical protein